jgi:hypothetical protein
MLTGPLLELPLRAVAAALRSAGCRSAGTVPVLVSLAPRRLSDETESIEVYPKSAPAARWGYLTLTTLKKMTPDEYRSHLLVG